MCFPIMLPSPTRIVNPKGKSNDHVETLIDLNRPIIDSHHDNAIAVRAALSEAIQFSSAWAFIKN